MTIQILQILPLFSRALKIFTFKFSLTIDNSSCSNVAFSNSFSNIFNDLTSGMLFIRF